MNPPPHTETPLKKSQRGWYRDPDPGLRDLRGKFEDAGRRNGEVKLAAMLAALAKFALLDEHGDPVVALTSLIKDSDFGYTDRASRRDPNAMRNEKPLFGPNAGLTGGSVGDRLGANSNERFGGV